MSASQNARETAEDAREGVHEFRRASAEASRSIESDLQALREDFRRLAEQIANVVANTGNAAWRHARSGVDDAVTEAEEKGREAANAVREVSGHFTAALDESIKTRPYTTLALVAGLAFLFGATWRR